MTGRSAAESQRSGVPSRRAVLRGAGAAAAATMLPASFWRSAGPAGGTGHRPRVVIVGSGLAGLGCAHLLWQRHRVRSEIYEFNPARAGGRVHTLRGFFDEGQTAENGGEFISSEHTATRALAAELGLTLDDLRAWDAQQHGAHDVYWVRGDGPVRDL